jgi:hypothetical protein
MYMSFAGGIGMLLHTKYVIEVENGKIEIIQLVIQLDC